MLYTIDDREGFRLITTRCGMELVQQVRRDIGNRPLIVAVNMPNPMVMGEIEPLADAILVGFDVQSQSILDIIAGHHEPQGRLHFGCGITQQVRW